MGNNKKWAQAVIKARGEMTQEQFAECTGIGRTTLSKYEIGKNTTKPTFNTIFKMASISSVSLEELVEAAGYSMNEIPYMLKHPLINAIDEVIRIHECPTLEKTEIELLKAVVNTMMYEFLKNK